MPAAVARANAQKSKSRSKVEQVFTHQKTRMGQFVWMIDLAALRKASLGSTWSTTCNDGLG